MVERREPVGKRAQDNRDLTSTGRRSIVFQGLPETGAELTETRSPDVAGDDPDILAVAGEAVMSLGTDVVFIVDATTLRLVRANRAFTRIFGYTGTELSELTIRDVVAGDPAAIGASLAGLIEEGETKSVVRSFRRKDGSAFEMESGVVKATTRGRGFLCMVARDLTERRAAEQAHQETEARLRTFVDAAFEGLALTDGGRIVDVNARVGELLRAPVAELLGRSVMDFVTPEFRDRVAGHFASGASQVYEHLCLRTDGTLVPVEVQAKTIHIGDRVMRMTAIRDISERKSLEEQVRLAQRMESVGRLAGGVAHDFNNLLTVILSLVKVLADGTRDRAVQEDLAQIETAAKRAAELTQQLLAFARRQIVEPQSIDLNELVAGIDKMLRRLIGEDIRLTTIPAPSIGSIRADPGKVEQVLLNLAVNARDAMEDGGKLTIETANVVLGEDYAATHPDVTPGRYVMLSVSDTGVGIDAATMVHIFEPFFTTKSPAKGTGLGLATCYGIVKQSGGSIWVYSEVGKGTTFKVYFPRLDEKTVRPKAAAVAVSPSGTETLLVVEDDDMVRRLAVRVLRSKGYTVHETGDPHEAIVMFDQLPDGIDLLIADVVMSGMSGRDLAQRLRERRPNLKVLYTSGYTENTIVHHGVVDAGVNFLPKPYVPDELARRVRETLDKSP